MNPILQFTQSIKIRNFLIFIINRINFSWIIRIDQKLSSWNNRSTARNSHNLAFQQMFFFSIKMRISYHVSFQITSKHFFNSSCSTHLFRRNQRQFHPIIMQIIANPIIKFINSFLSSSFKLRRQFTILSSFSQSFSNPIVSARTQNLSPKSDLFGRFLKTQTWQWFLNSKCFFRSKTYASLFKHF